MFLSAYHYTGDPTALVDAYDVLRRGFPDDRLDLHVCVVTATGITVFDACPSREAFERFHVSAEFRGAVEAVGLPAPRTEPLGEVHAAVTGAATLR